jgi:GntP family gluconate:H+ symporter
VTNDDLPSLIESYGVIVVPLILILLRALGDVYLFESNAFRVLTDFIGYPVIAMLFGVGLSLFVARKHATEEVSEWFGGGVARAASIVAIVGAGGVLGRILLTAAYDETLSRLTLAR